MTVESLFGPDGPPRLTGPEQRWLSDPERDPAPRRSRSLTVRLNRATDRYSVEAGWVALALHRATATLPPSPRRRSGRRRPGPADPTLSAIVATIDTTERAARSYAHLAGPCLLTDDHDCPPSLTALATRPPLALDTDPSALIDNLFGTTATTPASFGASVSAMAAWHTVTVATVADRFRVLRQAGLSDDTARPIVAELEHLTSRMRSLADRLAEWTGDRTVRRCRAGCGAAAPDDRATCGRCRKANSRQRQREEQT